MSVCAHKMCRCPSATISANVRGHPGELQLVESSDIELEDFSVSLHVQCLWFAGDLLTSEARMEVVKKDLQDFQQRTVEHEHG